MNMNITITFKLVNSTRESEIEFAGLISAKQWLAMYGQSAFVSIKLVDNYSSIVCRNWDAIQAYIAENTGEVKIPVSMPEYMFKDMSVDLFKPDYNTLDRIEVSAHVFLFIDCTTKQYFYVYADETGGKSNPYPTYEAACAGLTAYLSML